MKGYFYGFASKAEALAEAPWLFEDDVKSGGQVLRSGYTLDALSWIEPPVLGPPDPETGECEILAAGVAPPAFTILSAEPLPALEARQITQHAPAGLA